MTTEPLIVRSRDGAIVDVVESTEKSRTKTLERGRLWVANGATGRVLPWGGDVDGAPCAPPLTHAPSLSGLAWFEVRLTEAADAAGETTTAGTAGEEPAHPTASEPPEIIARLEALVRARRRDLPEGSYTTHLFRSGRSKIRKKLGEEAVETILAADRDELRSEAADLLYHLTVLLVDEELPWSEVITELAGRG